MKFRLAIFTVCNLLFSSLAILVCISMRKPAIVVQQTDISDVVKTVAHVKLPDENYELLYADYDTDIAYYRILHVPVPELDVGCVVQDMQESKGIVTDILPQGFYYRPETTSPSSGMSGTPVYFQESKIGLISRETSGGLIFCVWN